VTLVLVDSAGTPLGALPPFEVDSPFWQDVVPVVGGARDLHGIDVTVLRLLTAEREAPHGGAVTYLAQTADTPHHAVPVEVTLEPHPNRAPYAEPGGPDVSLAWAAQELGDRRWGPVTRSEQQRTWNLSAIWRLWTPRGPVWLKQVPRFFAHEPAVLGWIAGQGHGPLVPRVIASDDGRMLLEHVDGRELYGVGADVRAAIAADVHPVQRFAADHVDALVRLGVPDRRAPVLGPALRALVARRGNGDARLTNLVDGLDERFARVAACGLPDTLVHGDLHPGNVIGDGEGDRRVVIDWGDSHISNPAFDALRLTDGLPEGDASTVLDAWAARWRTPDSDPEAAVELLRPVAALRAAAAYADFLDAIEPSEHPYHASDVPYFLQRAAELA
jgi:hypothetical protein